MTGWTAITSGDLTARINPFGAELSSLVDAGGRELMTDADPAFWTGRAPILFPVVGRLHRDVLRVDGREYPMKQHGFARRMRFEIVEAEAARAVFRLTDTGETRASYPFAFRLDVAFTLAGATLTVEATVANPGDAPLPASVGFHPAFAWPLPFGRAREAHRIVFERAEPAPVKRLDGGLIAGDRASPLDDRTLPLADPLFADDALVWLRPESRSVRYGAPDGPQLDVAFSDASALGVWSKPGARFVCIEPWRGHADPANYAGEFRDKPGVFAVPPRGTARLGMSVTLAG